jgi:NDP-mannose synthase
MSKAVILAGGLGTRLRPFTEIIPKPLLPVGEKSIMEIQIRLLASHGFDDIYVATNYMADYVQAYLGDGEKLGVHLHYSQEEKPLGTAGPLSLLRRQLTEPFLLMNGDILTRLDLAAFFRFALAQAADLTIATKIITTPFRFGNVKVDKEGYIVDVEEKPELKLEILAGIYCLKPAVLSLIPDGQYYGMDTLIKDMLARQQRIARYLIQEYWLDIGQVEDYSQAREVYSEHFREL